jgi:hypothetical protein
MDNVALRRSGRVASLLAVAGLVLGFTLIATAEDPKPGTKPKVAVVKPGEKKDDPKTTTPKTETPPSPVVRGPDGLEEPTRLINEYLSKAWKENNLTPAERCSDEEYLRRVTLDLVGRIATYAEYDRYMKDPKESRRAILVDRLLYDKEGGKEGSAAMKGNPEFASNWATLWTNWMMTRTQQPLYRRQIHLWLEDFFSAESQSYKSMVEQVVTAKGKTNDNGAVNYLLAHLGATNPNGRQVQEGAFDVVPITARTVRLFLGYQIQCTQCHDHPFNADWKQKHFWGMNVFFRQIERIGQPPGQNNNQMMQNAVLELRDNANFNIQDGRGQRYPNGIVFYEKRNGVYLPSEPMFLDGRKIPNGGQLSRREELARFITSHKNFNPAIVNRVWGHLFGRGMNVKPAADDFGEHNELVHPELLTKLGEAFAGSGGHDVRRLIKWVCASDAYNLKAVANKTNESAETDPYFSRMMLKMMTPEQLLESLITATKPAEGNADGNNAQRNLRTQWMNVLVRNFGDDEGNEVNYNGTILQALLMMNGRDINQAINSSGTAKEAQKRVSNPKAFIDYIFIASLNRPTTQREYSMLMTKLRQGPGGDPAVQDLFWALLNCNEFVLNH